jgi:orotidine-5'-phosphate decarboxylase/adenine/guanine phosphoribosyltransferase-like PRPP-binding protein
MKKRIAILPLDGISSGKHLLEKLRGALSQEYVNPILAYIKVNDGVHNLDKGGPELVAEIQEILNKKFAGEVGFFLDMKVFDVSGTLINYARKYEHSHPNILTVSSQCSIAGIMALRENLPDTKLAMISALTDMNEDECRRRFGLTPALKILSDLENIRLDYSLESREKELPKEPFDLVVCSPREVAFLRKNLPDHYGFIVPGIRDEWMLSDHQKRTTGVREALDLGATFVVMGAQLMKGNPAKGISAAESQRMTVTEVEQSQAFKIFSDPLQTLINCDGYYVSPKDEHGNYIGPVVAYAGTYKDQDEQEKNKVGFEYFNFARAEESPVIRDYFARLIVKKISQNNLQPTLVIGAPMGGLLLAADVARHLNCRSIFAEKKVTVVADSTHGVKEVSELIIKRHDVLSGDKVLIVEDVCNNFSTTDKLLALIEEVGAEPLAIACAINRSAQNIVQINTGESLYPLPVLSSISIPSFQCKQDDKAVAHLIADGKIVWQPKRSWAELKAAMKN